MEQYLLGTLTGAILAYVGYRFGLRRDKINRIEEQKAEIIHLIGVGDKDINIPILEARMEELCSEEEMNKYRPLFRRAGARYARQHNNP